MRRLVSTTLLVLLFVLATGNSEDGLEEAEHTDENTVDTAPADASTTPEGQVATLPSRGTGICGDGNCTTDFEDQGSSVSRKYFDSKGSIYLILNLTLFNFYQINRKK